jgi:endonuclease YncB( thermonuclease family)
LAGIVSVISIGGVLVTDIVANVVGGYISDQIKTWQTPIAEGPQPTVPVAAQEAAVATVAKKSAKPGLAPDVVPPREIAAAEPAATGDASPLPAEGTLSEPESAPDEVLPQPAALPAPPIQPLVLNGKVEKVIDTGTLKISGETVLLAGIKGLGSPYRDQLAKFIEEQGSQVRCAPAGVRHTCFVSNVDLALAALTNGAARLAPDATEQYRIAAEEARRNHRGIFQ